jgi:prevent-host-death family protein
MATGPFVIGVSDFRRRLADHIDEVGSGGHPLFITHHGIVTAVLISREYYRSWCPESDQRTQAGRHGDEQQLEPRQRHRVRSGWSARPARRVWTRYGWLDFELAQVLADQGVETELIWTEEGWWTDDEG